MRGHTEIKDESARLDAYGPLPPVVVTISVNCTASGRACEEEEKNGDGEACD